MFQACLAVNVETGDMFLRITQNGEFVPALVCTRTLDAHRRSPFLVALSVVMASRHGLSQKVFRTVSHTHFLSLVAERWVPGAVNRTDPAGSTQLDQWKGFLSAMVTSHEAEKLYMRNPLEEITKNKYNQGGLTLKNRKPDTFESNEKSELSFRQWSDEFSSWVERIDQHFEKDVEMGCTDARVGQGQVHCRSSARKSIGS